jgi:arylsulfatase A-like enzyme
MWSLSPEEVQGEVDAYEGAIAYIDAELGRLLAALDTRGRLSRTLLIIRSDHGEEFGEHRVFGHGHSLYLPSIHVPLVVILPKVVPAGVAETVSLRDTPATIQDVIEDDVADRLPGSSLRDTWNGTGPPRPAISERAVLDVIPPSWYPIARGDLVAVVHRGFHYIRRGDGHEELFDLAADPDEQRSLAGDQAAAPALAELRAIARRN